MKDSAQRVKTQALKDRIKLRHLEAKDKLSKKHPHAEKFFQDKGLNLGHIREHSARLLTAGTLAGALLVNSPTLPQVDTPKMPVDWVETLTEAGTVLPKDTQAYLVNKLKDTLPPVKTPLTQEQERQIGFLIEKMTGIKARATLEGERLNTAYGLIGAEQHLPRFPGDTVAQHDEWQASGVTPGRGAWGYFAYSKSQMTKDDVLREKYYVAVQTLYLPDWNTRFRYLRDWYKYRKVIVVNPNTGKSVVAVIGDAGPAAWTGKHFGGSPEVMYHLGYHTHMRKGPVLLYFVDDPDNKVPLGPVNYQQDTNLPIIESSETVIKV